MRDSDHHVIDFRNAYIFNTAATDDRPCNTCRTQALATCTLTDLSSGLSTRYALGKTCIGEHMYLDGGIAQVPTAEVCIIFGEDRYKLFKKHADHRNDLIQIARPDDNVKLFDGRTASWCDLRFEMPRVQAQLLEDTEDRIRATETLKPLVARTVIESADRRAELEYPVAYMNFRPDRRAVQIDTGPIIYAGTSEDPADDIESLGMAYIIFERFDRVEFAVRVPVSIDETKTMQTLHYADIRHSPARTHLYAIPG